MNRDANYVADMLAVIEEIESYQRDRNYPSHFRAVERCLSILGEAARQLSEGLKQRYPDTPWKSIAGTRNMLIHEYRGIDEELIWRLSTIICRL